MTSTYNYDWNQGEDLTINIVYKSGPTGAAVPVDLTSYKFRMDIVGPNGKALTVLNDEAIADTDPFTAGSQGDTTYEVVLDNAGGIVINLSRALTLPGGVLYPYLTANPAVVKFSYDMFLRDATNKQKKILMGSLTISKSVTKWL